MSGYLIILVAGIIALLVIRKVKKIGHVVFAFFAVALIVAILRSKGIL